jgi:hypothetical protein
VEWWELFDFEKFISAQGLIGEADFQWLPPLWERKMAFLGW